MPTLDSHYWGATSGAARTISGNLAPGKFRNGQALAAALLKVVRSPSGSHQRSLPAASQGASS